MNNHDLFTYLPTGEAVARAREGIRRADMNASDAWRAEAELELRRYLEQHATMFVDDFHKATGWRFATRAFGAVVRRAVSAGLVEKTAEARPSVCSNLSLKPVWRSLVREGSA